MKVTVKDGYLQVGLNLFEGLVSFHPPFRVNLERIRSARAEKRQWDWVAVRHPGSHIPFLLKSGTYQTVRGREFWFVTPGSRVLVIDLEESSVFDRIVLSVGGPEEQAEKISRALGMPTSTPST